MTDTKVSSTSARERAMMIAGENAVMAIGAVESGDPLALRVRARRAYGPAARPEGARS